jgi:hypothetical protein
MLSEVNTIRFAFVSRKNKDSNKSHIILGTHAIEAKSFAQQINLNMSSCWAILKEVIDLVYGSGE